MWRWERHSVMHWLPRRSALGRSRSHIMPIIRSDFDRTYIRVIAHYPETQMPFWFFSGLERRPTSVTDAFYLCFLSSCRPQCTCSPHLQSIPAQHQVTPRAKSRADPRFPRPWRVAAMALAWGHQTRLDAVPRKATRKNLDPKSWGRCRVAVDEPHLVLCRRTLITSELEAQRARGIHVLCCYTPGPEPHPRAREAEHRRRGRLESRNIDYADPRGRPACLQPVRKNVLECLRDRLTGYRFRNEPCLPAAANVGLWVLSHIAHCY